MKAITVEPHKPGTARLEDIPEPDARDGSVLVEAIAVGVCGTDVEIVEGKYGWAPPGKTRLVLGHESLGRVLDPGPSGAPAEGRPGRRHRPPSRPRALPELRGRRVGHVPQRPVHRARHQADRRLHVRALAHRAGVRDEGGPRRSACSACCSSRPPSSPRPGSRCRRSASGPSGSRATVLVTGAGPIGLLAALVGKQHGLEVHVLDRVESGAKPELVRALGATYHTGTRRGRRLQARRHHRVHGRRPGDRRLASSAVGAGGVVCLTGVGSGGRTIGLRPRTSPRRWCCRTTSSSAASTPTSGTGTRRRRCWRTRTARGSARLITRRERPEAFMRALAAAAGRHQGGHRVLGRLTGATHAARRDSGRPESGRVSCLRADGVRPVISAFCAVERGRWVWHFSCCRAGCHGCTVAAASPVAAPRIEADASGA